MSDRLPPLTDELVETLRALAALTEAHGFPPSFKELGEVLGIKHAGVESTMQRRLVRLRAAGLVDWTPGAHRALRVLPAAAAVLNERPAADSLRSLVAELHRHRRVLVAELATIDRLMKALA